MRRLTSLLLAAALAAGACASDGDAEAATVDTSTAAVDGPSTTVAPPSTVGAPSTTASACGTDADLAEGRQNRTITLASGEEATFIVRLPAGYDPERPSPLVVNLHGRGSDALQQMVYGSFLAQADADHVILVMPNPNGRSDDGRPAWDAGAPGEGGDLDLVRDVVAEVTAEYCVDGLFAAGMSSGGFMTSALACWSDSGFDGFGPVAGGFYDAEVCAGAPPRPIVWFHGTADDTVLFEGTDDFAAVPEQMQAWAEHNGCSPEPVDEQISSEVVQRTWVGCEAPTTLYIVEGKGHSWPGSFAVDFLGTVTDQISASDLIWELWFGEAA